MKFSSILATLFLTFGLLAFSGACSDEEGEIIVGDSDTAATGATDDPGATDRPGPGTQTDSPGGTATNDGPDTTDGTPARTTISPSEACDLTEDASAFEGEPCVTNDDCGSGLCNRRAGFGIPKFEGVCHQNCFFDKCPEVCEDRGECNLIVDSAQGDALIDPETGLRLGRCSERPAGDREFNESCGPDIGACIEGAECIRLGDSLADDPDAVGTCLLTCEDDDADCPGDAETDEPPVQCGIGAQGGSGNLWCIQRCVSTDECPGDSFCGQHNYCGFFD